MEIYIELFIIQNILINFCLLKLVKITTKIQTNNYKLVLSSLLGTLPSIISIMFLNNNLIINLIKILCSTLMILTAFKPTFKQFVFNTILLFLYTYAFGGIIISLSSSSYITNFGIVTSSKFNIETICLIFIFVTQIFELIASQLKTQLSTNKLLYNLTLTNKNRQLKISAYMDTGNFINIQGTPVLILDLDIYLKLTNSNLIQFLSADMKQIKLSTVNGNNNLKTATIDKVEFKNGKNKIVLTNQIVAINTTNCFKNTNYKALLSPLFL